MSPEQFVTNYEAALATQNWENVAPLICPHACVTFSGGSVHKGIKAIQDAYERNFSLIKSEEYLTSNVYWILKNKETAVYLFNFSWKGIIDGHQAAGSGRGTTVIINDNGLWKLLAEHLGPASA